MTTTPSPAPMTVRLSDHWRDPPRVEAGDAFTLRRAARVLNGAGYRITASPQGTCPGPGLHTLCCDDIDRGDLQRVLLEAGIAVIAAVTRPTPAEEAEDEAAWQVAEAGMEADAEAALEAERLRPAPDEWAPF